MRKLSVFNQVSVDGFFKTPDGDVGWTHRQERDAELDEFVASNASGGGALVFGRVTYEMMASFWPTQAAKEQFPVVAEHMNARPKIVFSRTLAEAPWTNTTLVKGELVAEMRRMKSEAGPPLVILGSGSIVSQLASDGLIDEYQILILPVVLGAGTTMFDGLKRPLDFKLTKTRTFRNGDVFVTYEPER